MYHRENPDSACVPKKSMGHREHRYISRVTTLDLEKSQGHPRGKEPVEEGRDAQDYPSSYWKALKLTEAEPERQRPQQKLQGGTS